MNLCKKINFSIILIIITLSTFAQKTDGIRQKINPPYNIKDYFLLLPDSLLKTFDKNVSLNQRQLALKYKTLKDLWNHNAHWIIDTLDYKNGYMKLSSTGDGSGTYFEITYFIKKDKTREIAVNTAYWDLAVTSSSLKFYSFKNDVWKDITKQVLPEINLSLFTNEELSVIIKSNTTVSPILFVLPQKGKNIIAKIDIGTIDNLFDENSVDEEEYIKIKESLKQIILIWNDGIFKIQK